MNYRIPISVFIQGKKRDIRDFWCAIWKICAPMARSGQNTGYVLTMNETQLVSFFVYRRQSRDRFRI